MRSHSDLNAVHQIANRIVAADADAAVRLRVLRAVLNRPSDDPQVVHARDKVTQSRWVRELEAEQWQDGSWGRLHSQDSAANQRIPTTEFGVQRALALGLDGTHPVLHRACQHLSGILAGRLQPRDRAEKNDRWATGVRLWSAATLAQIPSALSILNREWELWVAIARRAFAAGAYDPEAETLAHRELTGASVKNSYLVLDNKYALTLLGSRATALPADVRTALVNWIWHRPDGIRYLGERLKQPPRHRKAGRLERWFASLELVSRFPEWRVLAQDVVQWLWGQRNSEGLWDFGSRVRYSIAFPLSETWRKIGSRQFDWSTRVLVLLGRYHSIGERT